MKKFLKWTLIVISSLAIILFGLFKFMQYQTKKASPEHVTIFDDNGKYIKVAYCSPSKRGRDIFGNLVKYNEVWRTGANEATTFETNNQIVIGGKNLPAGKYTLWTIPNKDEWTVIFNSKQYGWGMGFDGKLPREPEADVLQIKVPVQNLENVVERFTITFEETPALAMTMAWDKTKIAVPIQ